MELITESKTISNQANKDFFMCLHGKSKTVIFSHKWAKYGLMFKIDRLTFSEQRALYKELHKMLDYNFEGYKEFYVKGKIKAVWPFDTPSIIKFISVGIDKVKGVPDGRIN